MIDQLAPSGGDGGSTTDGRIGLASAPPCAIGIGHADQQDG
jgi:hypothetical protein